MNYLTASQAAERANVHADTIRRACESGELTAGKLLNQWMITPEALNGWMAIRPAANKKRRKAIIRRMARQMGVGHG